MCWNLVLTNGLLIGYTNGILVAVLNMDDFLWDMFPSLREGNQHAHVNNKCKYMDHKQQFLSLSMSLISLPSFLASAFLCFKYGRKSMLYLALLPFAIRIAMNTIASGKFMVLTGRAMLSIGVGFYSQSINAILLSGVGSDGLVPRAMAIGIDVLCALYSFNFALVSSPLGWLGETYPLVVRILGVVPPTSSNFALSLIIAQLSQVIMCRLQIWIFIISAILNAIGAYTIYFFIPETTWILPDLMPERVWKRHWFWKLYFPNRNRDDPPADV